jgi:uncharacterized SAM-binding protein YcdF (DUF218 family)
VAVPARRPLQRRIAIGATALLALILLAHSVWLGWLGRALVRDDGPAKADAAVVLAGDYTGGRIVKAAELVRAGYVPAVLVSGPEGFYGVHECDPAIAYAARRGYPAAWFIPLPNSALSTRDEAAVVLAEARRRSYRSILLVTSNYHTARAARVYRAAERANGGGPAIRVVAAPDRYFSADSWWRSREGQKTAFFEWSKTLANKIGM